MFSDRLYGILLEYRADNDERGHPSPLTPLQVIYSETLAILALLLKHGADLEKAGCKSMSSQSKRPTNKKSRLTSWDTLTVD